ncbi:hypothetical protein O181_055129 [Austropuccinia psidii MF-1]|uniref:Uncharacterized protein n=1 Tax=Austropuccinia psidii MF-1 TaxID=1389203 RepID=A0A9Q3E5V7_9BASI|nr:hypothetical protein [Austropuccinia psidii MF-1]
MHNELISSSKEFHGSRKDRGPSEGVDTHILQRRSPKDKSLVEKPKYFVRGPEEDVGPKNEQQPCGSSSRLHKQESSSTSAKQGKASPKEQSEGKAKGKGKATSKWNRPYPQNYRIPKKEKKSLENVFNIARTLMEFKNKGEERMNQSFPKKIDLVNLVTHFEICNKEIFCRA